MAEVSVKAGAYFSEDRLHRYSLWREWSQKYSSLHFLLLNPSTADEVENDPTVERCERRARSMGYGGVVVTNIFSWRSTDPKGLITPQDPVGRFNDGAIRSMSNECAMTVCGWGSAAPKILLRNRVEQIRKLLANKELWCLDINADGNPKHPLYVGYSTQPRIWKRAYE